MLNPRLHETFYLPAYLLQMETWVLSLRRFQYAPARFALDLYSRKVLLIKLRMMSRSSHISRVIYSSGTDKFNFPKFKCRNDTLQSIDNATKTLYEF